jgi:hypothetical protein
MICAKCFFGEKNFLVYVIFLILILPIVSPSNNLLLLSPNLEVYNVTDNIQNITLSLDYFNMLNTKKLFLQVDNKVEEIRNKNFIKIYDNPEFTQEGILHLPTKISNWIKYDFSLYLNDKKAFSIKFTNENKENNKYQIGIEFIDSGSYKGWYCYNDNSLKKINLKNTLYYNLSIVIKSNGMYFYSYDILENQKFIANCAIPKSSVKYIDLVKIVNKNSNKIITKSELYTGTYKITLTPGYHKVILFAYLNNGSLYNVSRDFFVILNKCGDMVCEKDEQCEFDCNNNINEDKGLSLPNWINQENLILSIDSSKRLISENNRIYLVFDLSKNQYDAKFSLNNLELDNFYIEDYFFARKLLNYTDLFSYELDNTPVKNNLIPLEHNKRYTLRIHLVNLSMFKVGDNYGLFDFSGITSVYYKVIMPRDLFSLIHLPKDKGVPTFTERTVEILKKHKLKLIVMIIILIIIYLFLSYHKKKIRETSMKIKEKYGVEIE